MSKAKTTASLVVAAALALAAIIPVQALAAFGIAPINSPGNPAVPAIPGEQAVWAGTCDLHSASTSEGGFGTAPGIRRHCIDVGAQQSTTASSPWAVGHEPKWRLDPVTQAGAHPDATGAFFFTRLPSGQLDEYVKDIIVRLPPGVVGSPTAIPQCSAVQAQFLPPRCPANTEAGMSTLGLMGYPEPSFPVYNLEARDTVTAEFVIGGILALFNVPITARGRTNGDYGVDTLALLIPTTATTWGGAVTLWGVPWAAEHDKFRLEGADIPTEGISVLEGGLSPSMQRPYEESWGPIKPFFTNPTRCQPTPLTVGFDADSWENPGNFVTSNITQELLTGCDKLKFDPLIVLHPTVNVADSPSGLDVTLETPQNNDPPEDVAHNPTEGTPNNAPDYWKTDAGLGTAHLRNTTVHLPIGTSFNPGAADGLQGCSTKEIGLTQTNPTLFNNDKVTCPPSSKIGTLRIDSPLLPDPLFGDVYVAPQSDNPYPGSLTAIYLVAQDEERGLSVKLSGKVDVDPATGQISTTFVDNPQLPFDKFELHFEEGPRAPLNTPAICGHFENAADLIPWSFPDSGPEETIHDPFDISAMPNGLSCVERPQDRTFKPGFDAGTTSTQAGAHADFVLNVTRRDGEQEISGVAVDMPPGLVASLKGIPYCSAAQIDEAKAKSGLAETNSSSCPQASYVGKVDSLAGAGSNPLHTEGKIYLAGPYDPDGPGPKPTAPLSVVVVVPAIAGGTPGNPLVDLGNVVIRTGINLDPETAQVHTEPTAVPYIVGGVPLRVRRISVDLNRPGFVLNPTSCEPFAVGATIGGAADPLDATDDIAVTTSSHFQVGDCAALRFKPNLSITLKGGTKRSAHPELRAVVNYPPGEGYSNVKTAQVALPHSEFLDNAHIVTICTRPQFAAKQCPAGSIYGHARAFTPLLDEPLEGPVYLKSSEHELPDLVAALHGQVDANVVGRIDSINEGIRTTFEATPDVPVEKFVLTMKGGNKGLLINSTNICTKVKVSKRHGKKVRRTVRGSYAADAFFVAHNGKEIHQRVPLKATNCAKAKRGKRHGHRG